MENNVVENKENGSGQSTSILGCLPVLIGVIALLFVFHSMFGGFGGIDAEKAVRGKIFEYQINENGKYQTLGYIAFGTDKEDDGVLLYEKETEIEKDNESGKLASQLYNASENSYLYWTSPEDTVVQCPNGLALPSRLDEPFFEKFSISVDKVSGIFKKTITGKTATKLNFGGSGATEKMRLIQIDKLEK